MSTKKHEHHDHKANAEHGHDCHHSGGDAAAVQMASMTSSLLVIPARSIPAPCTQMFAMFAIQVAPSAGWLWNPKVSSWEKKTHQNLMT